MRAFEEQDQMRTEEPKKRRRKNGSQVRARTRGLVSRRISETTILTDKEVAAVVGAAPELLGEPFASIVGKRGSEFEDLVRFGPVSRRCVLERERRGWTRKDVGAALRAPQYRLETIERAWVSRMDAELVPRYIAHLGLQRWFRQWKLANPALAKRMGWVGPSAVPVPQARRRRLRGGGRPRRVT